MRLFFPLSGDDVFISYSRRDGALYAAGLADKLTEKKLSCFIDKLGTEPNHDLPPSLKKKIRNCTVFVLVGTEKATQSEFVKKEIAEFKQTGRTILPIDFGGNVANAIWYEEIPGLAVETEKDAEALETGNPSQNVTGFIEKSFKYTRRNQYMSRMFWGALSVFLVLVGLGVGASYYAVDRIKFADEKIEEARLAKVKADEENEKARKAEENATNQEQIAKDARSEAKKQSEIAEEEKIKAEKAGKLADEKSQLAIAKTKLADEKTKLADLETKRANEETQKAEQAAVETRKALDKEVIARTETEKQQKISTSQSLANKSQRIFNFKPEEIFQSASYALDSMKITTALGIPSLESDRALRESLALLPTFNSGKLYNYNYTIKTNLSPDARHLAVLTDDRTLKIYRTDNHQFIKSLPAKFLPLVVAAIAISNNARYVAVSGYDNGTTKFFDLWSKCGEECPITLNAYSESVALSPDGNYLAVLLDDPKDDREDNIVGLLKTNGGQEMITFGSELNMVMHGIAFSSDGKVLAVGGRNITAKGPVGLAAFWSDMCGIGEFITENSNASPETESHDKEILAIAVGPQNTYAVMDEENASVWKRDKFFNVTAPVTYLPQSNNLQNIAFNSDGTRISTVQKLGKRYSDALAYSKFEVWDSVGSPHIFQRFFSWGGNGEAREIAFQSDDNSIIATNSFSQPRVWQVENNSEYEFAAVEYEQKIFQSENLRFVIGKRGKELWVRDVLQAVERPIEFDASTQPASSPVATVTESGLFLAVSGVAGNKNAILIYELVDGTYIRKEPIPVNGDSALLKFAEDGKSLIVLNSAIQVLDVDSKVDLTPEPVKKLKDFESIIISPKGKHLIVKFSQSDKIFRINDGSEVKINDGSEVKELQPVRKYFFSPQDRYLISCFDSKNPLQGSYSREIIVSDLLQGNAISLQIDSIIRNALVTAVAFSPDEKYFAVGTSDGSLSVFETISKTEVAKMQYSGEIWGIAFNQQNKYLAVAFEIADMNDLLPFSNDVDGNDVLKVSLLQPQDLINETSRRIKSLKER